MNKKQKELINKAVEMVGVCQDLMKLVKEQETQIKYLKLTCNLQEIALKESAEYIEMLELGLDQK